MLTPKESIHGCFWAQAWLGQYWVILGPNLNCSEEHLGWVGFGSRVPLGWVGLGPEKMTQAPLCAQRSGEVIPTILTSWLTRTAVRTYVRIVINGYLILDYKYYSYILLSTSLLCCWPGLFTYPNRHVCQSVEGRTYSHATWQYHDATRHKSTFDESRTGTGNPGWLVLVRKSKRRRHVHEFWRNEIHMHMTQAQKLPRTARKQSPAIRVFVPGIIHMCTVIDSCDYGTGISWLLHVLKFGVQ